MSDLLASAWVTVTRHRLRSALAIAAVAMGVCALTSIISVEQSWRRAVTSFFGRMDLETVRVGIPRAHLWRERGYSKPALDSGDAQAIVTGCPAVKAATLVTWAPLRVEQEGYVLQVSVRAVDAGFADALPDAVREGRFLTAEEVAARSPVCVLSRKARVYLFGDDEAIGSTVRIGGHRFQVVGVIGGGEHFGLGEGGVYIPMTWARSLLRADGGAQPQTAVFGRTDDPRAASEQIDRLLRARIGGEESTHFTQSLWEAREAAVHARGRATLYSGLAAMCALLAAGIGIAAQLFVSVSERSWEIGIARALGASRRRVYAEHVMAALLLSGLGGLLGGLAGIPASAAAAFASRWQPALAWQARGMLGDDVARFPRMSDVALAVSWEALAVALALALLTGVFAALAPASEAAAVDPARAIAQRPGARRRLRRALTATQVTFGVLVLVVLTSYFALLSNEERVEERGRMGQDWIAATADPIAAMRTPVPRRDREACGEALARVLGSPDGLAALRAQTPLVEDVSPLLPVVLDVGEGGLTVGAAQVIFATDDFLAYQRTLEEGDRARVAAAFRDGSAAAVIDPGIRERLFPNRDPLGRTLSVAGKKFSVVAVCGGGFHLNGTVWLPLAYYDDLRHRRVRDEQAEFYLAKTTLRARPHDERQYTAAAAQLRSALLPMLPPEHRAGIKLSEDIPLSLRELLAQSKAAAARGAVGALAVLLVALIGLANMLLVSVHDEMREIGVRRALGAQRPEVLLHFLSEGIGLSAAGAAAGLAIGALVCWVTKSWAHLPMSVVVFWAAAGAVATVASGTLTSLIPAFVAARVHPVEALRYGE